MQFAYNPFTDELDVIGTANQNGFLPYSVIAAGLSITIPAGREMFLAEELVVLGELTVLGHLALHDDSVDDSVLTEVGDSPSQIFERMYGDTENIVYTYNANGTVNYVEGFSSSATVTANRIYKVSFTYNADLTPATETTLHYSFDDGTTVLKTVVVTYTWSSGLLTQTAQVTS